MHYYILLFILFFYGCSSINHTSKKSSFDTKNIEVAYTQDELRGSNTEYRNWWNVLRYDIVLEPNYDNKFLEGTVVLEIEKTKDVDNEILQIDLQEPMQISKIVELNINETKNKIEEFVISNPLYKRLDNTYFVDVSNLKNIDATSFKLKIYFNGNPRIAKRAPWDGGWIFTHDEKGRPWMSAAVQGLGASSWFPCKDYQGDEPDNGMTLTLIVPEELVAVSNGRLWETSLVKGEAGENVFTWEVRNPINSYNIIPYIGHYVNISDAYMGKDGPLSLEYWVLDYNETKAKEHFEQVKPMLTAFEDWMGPYPFYQDGYKLVESPYLGMEHQSAVAYGNQYLNGYLGMDTSGTGYGNMFDFIIIHESGHEWFGNSITTEDIADMWVHEGFTTYTEAMYVENQWGKVASESYVQGLRSSIENKKPIIGTYGTQSPGSRDMYYKGANVIHTLRQLMKDDAKFKNMILSLNKQFYHQIVTSEDVESYIADYTGLNLKTFFDQYLRTTDVPVLEVKIEDNQKYYRWSNVVDGFAMPLKLLESDAWIKPNETWQVYNGQTDIIPDPNFYVFLKDN